MANGIVTKAGLARELQISRSSITRLSQQGLPVLPNGRLDRKVALDWIAKFCSSVGGGWLVRRAGRPNIATKAQELLAQSEPTAQKSEFNRGAEWAALEVCRSARQAFPRIFSKIKLNEVEELIEEPKERQRRMRALLTSLTIYLVEGWVDRYIDRTKLPAIDWGCFGEEAGAARDDAEGFFEYWSGGKRKH